MTFGDLLASPYLWAAFGICFIAGWYVRRDLFGALAYGTIAPLALLLIGIVVSFALAIPAFVISTVFPEFWKDSTESFRSLPAALRIVLNPAVLVTAAVFVIHCWSAREDPEVPKPEAATPAGEDSNPSQGNFFE
jgi:uncharacterized membrane protein YkgB